MAGQHLKNYLVANDVNVVVIFLCSQIVKEFLCLDDPPGPFDSLEESRVSHLKIMKERLLDCACIY